MRGYAVDGGVVCLLGGVCPERRVCLEGVPV